MEDKFSLVPHKDLIPDFSPSKPLLKENSAGKKPLGPPAATKKVISEELTRLKSAITGSQTLNTYMSLEEKYLELKDFHETGQTEDPYQQTYPDFLKCKTFEIPEALLEKYRKTDDCSVLSGILPEIQRVWYAFDNILYFWDYLGNNRLLEYPVTEDIIVNVALVPKNSELFTNKVACMLLIATRNQISFVGVSMDPDFKLIEADMKVATDEVPIQCVSVLKNGRILMGGADGSISELKYSNTSWFSSSKRYKRSDISSSYFSVLLPKFIKDYNANKVSEISVDNSRNILYSLVTNDSGKYRIEMYDLGAGNNKHKRVCKITSLQLLQRLRDYNQRLCNINPDRLQIVHIEALSRQFTTEFHLMGLTFNGIRVFFTFYEQPTEISDTDPLLSLRPQSDFSIYVKFPPTSIRLETKLDLQSYSLGATSDKPTYYEKCVMLESGALALLEQGERVLRILCIGRSLSRIALYQGERANTTNQPEETVCCIEELREIDVQHIKEIKSCIKMSPNIARLCNYAPRGEYREKHPIRYLGSDSGRLGFECLSNLSNILYRPSSDLLVLTSKQLIKYSEVRPIDMLYESLLNGQEKHHITEFVQRFGVLHTCAMLLALIIGPVSVTANQLTITTPLPEQEKAQALGLFKEIGNHRILDAHVYSYRPEDPLMCLCEYKALYLYLSRILRPIWEEKITFSDGNSRNQVEEFQSGQLNEVKIRLIGLKKFINEQYAENAKKPGNCVHSLLELIKRNEDCLELLSLITEEYCFRRVVNELIIEDQVLLQQITYHELVSSSQGHSLAKVLIEAYILQLRNPRTVRQKRPSLEECLKNLNLKCSSFFTLVDSEIYIAQECLYKAISEEHQGQRNELIDEAMKRLLRNAVSVGLGRITFDLKTLRFYRGIICLCIQKAIDINDIKADEGASEIEECYTYLTRMLSDLKDSMFGFNSASYWFDGIPFENIKEIKEEIINEFCKHHDKNVHRILFTWLIDCGLSSEILLIDSPFTKAFIEESTKKGLISESALLGKYCMKMKDFLNAYKEFDRLASLKKVDLKFETRLEYFDLCSHCLDKHIETFSGPREEKTLLEQERENHLAKKKLARIQSSIRQVMLNRADLYQKAGVLEKELYSVNDLFDNFAKQYGLYLSQFEILDYIYVYTSGDKKEIENIMRSTFIPLIKEYSDQQWPALISEKLEELGTKYPYCFNMEYIIKKVEALNAQKGVESNWLVVLIISLPIDQGYSEIWTIYYDNWKTSFVNSELLYMFTLRCEAVIRAWFSDLKKRMVETAIWNKNAKEKASPYKFIEKVTEIASFFNEVKSIKEYLSPEKCIRVFAYFDTQETIFQGLRSELVPSDARNNVLKRRINFESADMLSERSRNKESVSSKPFSFNNNV